MVRRSACGLLVRELHLLARAVLVIGKDGVLHFQQLVPEVGQEPDHEVVMAEIRKLL